MKKDGILSAGNKLRPRIRPYDRAPPRLLRWRMLDKLKSRKFWVAIATALLVALNDQLGLGMSDAQLQDLVMTAAAYLVGQGYVDGQQEKATGMVLAARTEANGWNGKNDDPIEQEDSAPKA